MLSSAAWAHEDSGVDCSYSDQVTPGLELPVSGQVISESRERDKDSGEHLVKRELRLESGDSVYIEQKYCTMYNLTVVYRLTEVNDSSFEKGLGVIHSVITSVDQDYQLKSPLEDIVNMTMNQRDLTLDESFEYGLPLQAARSSDNVEHTIGFERLPEGNEFVAEIQFYLGVGGL
ncbi:hypothetical protein [Marinimicrobium locisalis]|uniref:hypothetical protein n=1 Tax=Marinimicrobium locisalis TaxID=546022 RepID=UPI0032217F50